MHFSENSIVLLKFKDSIFGSLKGKYPKCVNINADLSCHILHPPEDILLQPQKYIFIEKYFL